MARLYAYVGPAELLAAIDGERGAAIRTRDDLIAWVRAQGGSPVIATYVVDDEGVLRVAPRRSEHVACAGGGAVRAAGELSVDRTGVVLELSNQSTGYCPDLECLDAAFAALRDAGIAGPVDRVAGFVFRRCDACGERAVVKDAWYVCDLCGADLARAWNF
jgi:hypothetical protein